MVATAEPPQDTAKNDLSRPAETKLSPAERIKKLDELEQLQRQAAALSAEGKYDKAVPAVLKRKKSANCCSARTALNMRKA